MASRTDRRAAAAARHRLLPGGRVAGPMLWIIAIMMFLTVLAAAAGLGLGAAVRSMSADLAGRASVQVVEANPQLRDQLAALQTERDAKCREVLSPEQQKRLDELAAAAKAAREAKAAAEHAAPPAATKPAAKAAGN